MRRPTRIRPTSSRACCGTSSTVRGRSAVYARAAESQVACGIGHWRVLTEYASESTFNQEIRIAPVSDMVFVLWDPDSLQLTRSDAEWCHVPVDISADLFKRRYPEGTVPTDFKDSSFKEGWSGGSDTVRLTEYWWKEKEKKLLAIRPDGAVDDLSDEDMAGKRPELELEAAVMDGGSSRAKRSMGSQPRTGSLSCSLVSGTPRAFTGP
jgi:hypothetical protein